MSRNVANRKNKKTTNIRREKGQRDLANITKIARKKKKENSENDKKRNQGKSKKIFGETRYPQNNHK